MELIVIEEKKRTFLLLVFFEGSLIGGSPSLREISLSLLFINSRELLP